MIIKQDSFELTKSLQDYKVFQFPDVWYLHLCVASSDQYILSIVSLLCWKYQIRPSRQLSHFVTVSPCEIHTAFTEENNNVLTFRLIFIHSDKTFSNTNDNRTNMSLKGWFSSLIKITKWRVRFHSVWIIRWYLLLYSHRSRK